MKGKYTLAAAITGLSVLVTGVSASAAPVIMAGGANFQGQICELTGGQLDINELCEITGISDVNALKEKLESMGIDCPILHLPGVTPETPEQPETPETPEQPETPETPEQPETPENPEQPETPETPELPETPEIPEAESPAMQVINLVNQERAREGLPALTYDADIAKAAQVRAKETEVSFSHTRPNGSSFSTALTENGVSYRGSGENIAYGQKSPEEVMKGWMDSPGHRANIMNKNFTKIGVGYYQNSNGVKYWTQLFTY